MFSVNYSSLRLWNSPRASTVPRIWLKVTSFCVSDTDHVDYCFCIWIELVCQASYGPLPLPHVRLFALPQLLARLVFSMDHLGSGQLRRLQPFSSQMTKPKKKLSWQRSDICTKVSYKIHTCILYRLLCRNAGPQSVARRCGGPKERHAWVLRYHGVLHLYALHHLNCWRQPFYTFLHCGRSFT